MSMATVSTDSHHDGDGYEAFLEGIRATFAERTKGRAPLFTTDAARLFELFLGALPPERRQHYACNACRRFVDRFGGLVTIADDGSRTPVMWSGERAPRFFADAIGAMSRAVGAAKVTGVFLSDERAWGMPQNRSPKGIWHHMHALPAKGLVFRSTALRNASQAMAEKHEEHGMLCRALAEFPIAVVEQAVALLTTGNLTRSEKHLEMAKWLHGLHAARGATKRADIRDALTWRAVATAPAGWCHVRSGMIGTLLEDVQAGLPFDEIKRRHDEKMDPIKYLRPQAAPTAGAIAQAEKVVAALRSAGALDRRFARVDEVQAIWTPRAAEPPAANGGVFGHLKPKGTAPTPTIEQPPVTMTWATFQRDVLPTAEAIDFLVPHNATSYAALTTAVSPDAPPILQWDSDERRNPVCWYVYHNGSPPSAWNLTAGELRRVVAVTFQPSMWHDAERFKHQGQSVLFLLEDARDVRAAGGAALFPETMRAEYHAIRSVIEAHSRSASLAGKGEPAACGIRLQAGQTWAFTFRVTSRLGRASYKLDRWD